MWIYKNEAVDARLRLDPRTGFWIDYWLLLHFNETHSIWRARPFGIRSFAEAALTAEGPYHRNLRRALKRELGGGVNWLTHAPTIPRPPTDIPIEDDTEWSVDWKAWFTSVLAKYSPSAVVENLAVSLDKAIEEYNCAEIMFLTRRLAAELGEDEWHVGYLHNEIKDSILFRGKQRSARSKVSDNLLEVVTRHPNTAYSVQFSLSSFVITRQRGAAFRHPAKPTLSDEPNHDGLPVVEGVSIPVTAAHPAQAFAEAQLILTRILEVLRLQHHVQTHVHGGVKVEDVAAGSVYWFQLPQPFWKAGPDRRAVPRVPRGLDVLLKKDVMPQREADSLRAALWHLSGAFSNWPENVHGATAQTWQALEAYSNSGGGSSYSRVFGIYQSAAQAIPKELTEYMAVRLSQQRAAFKAAGIRSDWASWDSKREDLDAWLEKIMQPSSRSYYMNWKSPHALRLITDRRIGLLDMCHRSMLGNMPPKWMAQRLKMDLALTNALRNAAIHKGVRLFSRRMAEYLGRVGIEVLIGAIQSSLSEPSAAQAAEA